jgi:uncharacterized glyoxalase superfamily protein PhnB
VPAIPKNTAATIIPCLRYRDAPAAIDWLCRAFGFQRKAVYEGPENTIAHAELTFGNGMIMVGSFAHDSPYAKVLISPDEVDGKQTQSPYVLVEDADAVYAMAKAAGANILIDIKDESYGGRGFTCRDLEDYVWSFGTYDPWKTE